MSVLSFQPSLLSYSCLALPAVTDLQKYALLSGAELFLPPIFFCQMFSVTPRIWLVFTTTACQLAGTIRCQLLGTQKSDVISHLMP